MKILAIIMDPGDTEKILKHLVKTGRPPTNLTGQKPSLGQREENPWL